MSGLKIAAMIVTICFSSLISHSVFAQFDTFKWVETNPSASWAPRAGHQVLNVSGVFYLIAGRSPLDLPIPGASIIWGDVWKSDDQGQTWTMVLTYAPLVLQQ